MQGEALEKSKELFEREAEKLDELSHPQIPRVYDHFEEGNSLYLVEEFIEGETLRKEYQREGRFSEQKIKGLLQDLLPILAYLHSKKLIHRDIKPDNIMRRREDGKLILIDFGGVKEQTSQIGTGLYTLGYASYEHTMGKAIAASDLYSLGATCVRLLTGCFPPDDRNLEDPLYDVDETKWLWREILKQQKRQISDELGQILDKMLQHRAKERYQSAQEVLEALNTPKPVIKPPKTIVTPKPTIVTGGSTKTTSRITRRDWLKYLGWGGAGLLGMGIVEVLRRNWGSIVTSTPKPKPTVEVPSPVSPSVTSTPKLLSYNFDVITVNDRGEEINRQSKSAQYFTVDLGDGVTLDMVYIPGGTFMMGSPTTEKGRYDTESPQHQVTVLPFYIGKYPITIAQWQAVMGNNPAHFKDNTNNPVEQVSWDECIDFCIELSKKTPGLSFRLPSEAEWEYACRAGTTTPFHFGQTLTSQLANYNATYTYANESKGEYRQKTTPVGSFYPNAFGLYDMHGNIWEWCLDDWHDNYNGAPTDGTARFNDIDFQQAVNKVNANGVSMLWYDLDRIKTNRNNSQLLRGGSWVLNPQNCRSAYRDYSNPDSRSYYVGLRVVASSRT
jgi:formylglycine-generating enzyme required for sulfatase activity